MGIKYDDSIILYNRYVNGVLQEEMYVGTRFDKVRVELTEGANITVSGNENADTCRVKIPTSVLTKPYIVPEAWNDLAADEKLNYFTLDKANHNFFIIVKKPELGLDFELDSGLVESGNYSGGFLNYCKDKYGYCFTVNTVDIYQLIPRFEVSGN